MKIGIGTAMAVVAMALSASLCSVSGVSAQTTSTTVVKQRAAERPPTRLRVYPRYNPDEVYPRYNPGPNAVRDCTATYVQEFRPSGTVIVPHMTCFWRRG